MKRSEKSGDGAAVKEENLGEKLRKKRVGAILSTKNGKKVVKLVGGGTCTPVPSWRLLWHDNIIKQSGETVSARGLAAGFWEFQHLYLPLSKMQKRAAFATAGNGADNGAGDSRLLRRHQRGHHGHGHHLYKDKVLDLSHFLKPDPSPSSPDQPESAGSLRRHIAASLMQHHRAIERCNHALQPVSPASYGSSMEVAPFNPVVTPNSSLDFRGRVGESQYNLKTSTELLKVLNRIWSLEEQHASNVALIKGLKMELERTRIRVKELLRDQQSDRYEIDDLMKQIAEEKIVRKSKEQDRLHAAVQSVRDELEDERKLRKRSESLHRKLARELSEVKSCLSDALKEAKREQKSRRLLEDLCDEFANRIKEYEQELHVLKQKPDKDWTGRDDNDRLILHISESWLDERMQMKLEESESGFRENNSIVDKLGFEIEAFLEAKKMSASKHTDFSLPRNRLNSLESVPLNEAGSAPQGVGVGEEEDSACSDSNCFELNKPSNGDVKLHRYEAVDGYIDQTVKSNQTTKKIASRGRGRGRNPSSLQVKFEEQMACAMSCNGNKNSHMADTEGGKKGENPPNDTSISRKFENCEATEDISQERKDELDEVHGSNSNFAIEDLIRNHISLCESRNVHPENDGDEASCSYPARRNQASPVRQWMSKLTAPDVDITESSTKLPPAMKDNTLKAKLLEARSKGQRSRLKLFRGTS
ncbi:hypothetical protein CFOL_v3_07046 [Cephalotus follicularis]|uniref:Intracellular protein transporter USO1-like protein n=1 Tax=Cephalotus follicularis TaxID=3775 RepID=A0A1Q3B697_CEPFO|nr:hypothetical protein CFOL_v3_07046 [Cephalotus follicularis]